MNIENMLDQIHEFLMTYEEPFKNDYLVRGDETTIRITRRDGDIYYTTIDTDDLEKVRDNGTWCVYPDSRSDNFYVARSKRIGGKRTAELLHRVIMGNPKGLVVDHINHDTLDNRKSNLRAVTHAENMQNYKGAYKNSISGIRGVYLHKSGKWQAAMRVNGKQKHLGLFENIEDAIKVVTEARKKYMPYAN